MGEFGYTTGFKVSQFMDAGYPILGLHGLLIFWLFVQVGFPENDRRPT